MDLRATFHIRAWDSPTAVAHLAVRDTSPEPGPLGVVPDGTLAKGGHDGLHPLATPAPFVEGTGLTQPHYCMEIPMSTYDLLLELATLDEVSVSALGSMDGDLGHTPQWAELLLEIRRVDDGTLTPAVPLNARMPLRRHDGELIIEALNEVLHPQLASAQESLWEELDHVVVGIQRRVERNKDPLKRDVGQALGLATALSYLTGRPLDDIREMAMERYDEQ